MKNPFRHERIPALEREIAGIRFDCPIAIEPAPVLKGRHLGLRARHFAFAEISPIDDAAQTGLRLREKGSPDRVALNITRTEGRTPDELIESNADAFSHLYDFAEMFVLDTCRVDSTGAMPLQNTETLSEVLDRMMDIRRFYEGDKAVFVRISDMISERELADVLHLVRMSGVDAVIAGTDRFCPELLQRIRNYTGDRLPIIACGGINTYAKARELLDGGAALVQVQRIAAGLIMRSLETALK